MSNQFAPDYIDVPERIAGFREKHPEGSLQQVSVEFKEVNGHWGVLFTAAAYRTPDDLRPGIGTAWEPFPGKTPYTKDSEVQNAETSAWGRAIVAVLAGDTKRGIASAEEVRNRNADRETPNLRMQVWEASKRVDPDLDDAQRKAWIEGEIRNLGADSPRNWQRLLTEWSR